MFRNYYRRCNYYGLFLLPSTTWDNTPSRGFTEPERTGLKRDAATLAADLDGFLDCICSYLPFDYIGEKLKAESKNISSVWQIIYEVYDVELSTTNFLDYASMKKTQEETYRGYFNRLVGFVRQHLPQQAYEAEGIVSPPTGESLSISLLDSITIHWLISIDRRLLDIVKVEFATDLKTKRICQMVKTIAKNIDDLLARYEQRDSISVIKSPDTVEKTAASCAAPAEQNALHALIQRVDRLETSSRMQGQKKPRQFQNKRSNKCTHCTFLNNQLGASLRTDHPSSSCGKRSVSVNLVETLEFDQNDSCSSDTPEGGTSSSKSNLISFLQSPDQSGQLPTVETDVNQSCKDLSILSTGSALFDQATVSDNSYHLPDPEPPDTAIRNYYPGMPHSQDYPNASFIAQVAKLSSSKFTWSSLHRSPSPRLRCVFNGITFSAVIDSGAEVNVLDQEFAKLLKLTIIDSHATAQAANKIPLQVCGQTAKPLSVECITKEGTVMIHLGIVLIVANLGADCLLGEPAKELNNIICLPRQKLVLFSHGNTVHYADYDKSTPKYHLLRAITNVTLQPGDQLKIRLPDEFSTDSVVAVTPRPESLLWLQPSMMTIKDNAIFLTNAHTAPIDVRKSTHLADIRETMSVQWPQLSRKTQFLHSDTSQYQNLATSKDNDPKYLDQIQVDPDGVLEEADRDLFHKLHVRFQALFTPQPGKYNGHIGHIDNKLQFASLPPPNTKTHIPNYSPTMNSILAEKIDLLESWGVLAEPERLGVSVEYVSPSLLVPKPEPNEFRLVTDFSSLNLHLKKIPNTSATIAQAKKRIARARYAIHMDLSNYFYQCGLQHEDLKYLGTIHPYKGLRIYTCDPQGLKGASERCYEKLVCIYGDMVQQNRLAQMADGIHVLGNSVVDLAKNYVEVLSRAEACGLTFKPSKVVVCPRNIKLFGWELRDSTWFPTAHTISALANAAQPTTVKKLRSFLGSFKQLSASLPNYAAVVHALEQVVGGRASADRIVWTPELMQAFTNAKALAAHPKGISEPRPQDKLETYSDYSAESRAVGGRLVIKRNNPDGTTDTLIGGFFSAVLDKHKQHWLPCEGEAAAIRLVLEHFSSYIREADSPTVHYTDSQPCVLAWKKSRRGAFSSSSRISAFLTGISTLSVELRYKPGKEMHSSDFASRNPPSCLDQKCQICSFTKEWQDVGDNALHIRALSYEEIKSGKQVMPMVQKNVWKNIQANDPVHTKLIHLINTRQLPDSKKTKGDNTKIKLLHNLYLQGKLFVKDGLTLVSSPGGYYNDAVISVPPSLFPGITNALHIRLDHPSKGQLANLVSRYFYSPGWRAVIDSVTDSCHQCLALRKLPKVLLQDSHTSTDIISSRFAADVIERETQRILIVREHISQFTRGQILPDQTTDTLRQALLSLTLDLIPDSGAEVRVDGAPAFQSLERESIQPDSLLAKMKIKITVGRLINKNKNPCAENAVQEVLREILRLKPEPGPISATDLLLVLKNVNARIRYNSLTPKEILFRRDIMSNAPMDVNDKSLVDAQQKQKEVSSQANLKHNSKFKKKTPHQDFLVGDLVMLRNSLSKNKPRETFIIEQLPTDDLSYILIRKLRNSLRSRLYNAGRGRSTHAEQQISSAIPKKCRDRDLNPGLQLSRLLLYQLSYHFTTLVCVR